jgi:uncharacterized membrane protein
MNRERRFGLWALRVVSFAALGVSAYLLSVSLDQQRLPVGCGAGSGCAEVLASRWSSILGIPVSYAAAVIYLAVLVASFFAGRGRPPEMRRNAWSLLLGLAVVIAGAAAWFIALQIGVIHAICPWCMAGHALGLAVSILIVWQVPLARRVPNGHKAPIVNVAAGSADATGFIPPRRAVWLFCTGIAAVGLLAVAQWLVEPPAGRTIRLPPGVNADSGPGPNRRIAVIDGKFQVSPHELPVLGSADSPKLLLILFDYCCPHCRAAHGYLNRGRKTFGDELGVVLLPMPMDHKCNFTVQHTEPRFEHACELARLALAVWRADRKAFAAFDEWLFEPESPRDPAAARRKAEETVGADALAAALRDPWVNEQIAANVQAYADSGADRIPVLMSPGFSSIVGRPESEQQLLETLRAELQLGKNTSPADTR